MLAIVLYISEYTVGVYFLFLHAGSIHSFFVANCVYFSAVRVSELHFVLFTITIDHDRVPFRIVCRGGVLRKLRISSLPRMVEDRECRKKFCARFGVAHTHTGDTVMASVFT